MGTYDPTCTQWFEDFRYRKAGNIQSLFQYKIKVSKSAILTASGLLFSSSKELG